MLAGLPGFGAPAVPVVPRPLLPPVLVPQVYGPWVPWAPFRHFGFKNGTMISPIDHNTTRPASGFMASGRIHAGPLSVAAFEMELMSTHDGGLSPDTGADLWNATLVGFYAAFRAGETIYSKLKFGWRWRHIDAAEPYASYGGHSHTTMYFPGVNHLDWSTVPVALALGWRVGRHDVMEAEINYVDDDLYLFSVAYIF